MEEMLPVTKALQTPTSLLRLQMSVEWWQENKGAYPATAAVACHFLSVHAGNAARTSTTALETCASDKFLNGTSAHYRLFSAVGMQLNTDLF